MSISQNDLQFSLTCGILDKSGKRPNGKATMAKHIANNASAKAIANLKEFQGSNLRGTWENGVYAVYSYWTLMASYCPKTGAKWVNEQKYSRTTSKQMNYVRQGFASL